MFCTKNKEANRAAIYNAVYIDRNNKLSDELMQLSVENAQLASQNEELKAQLAALKVRVEYREWQH